jgi:tripartite motif-containing protein 71
MNSLMDTKTNGPNHVNDAWPMQNNREPGEHHVGGEQRRGGAQDSIWNSNSLFDFSPIVQTSDATLDAGWQSLQNQPVSNGGAASWSSVVGTRAVNGPPTGTPQQPPPGFGPHTNNVLCTSCDDKRPTCARCKECAEDLCEACAVAHKRVKAVKDHHVEWHTSPDTDEKDTPKTPTTAVGTTSSVQVMSSLSMQPQFMGGLMTNRGLVQSDVLQVYKGAVEKAKADSKTLITNSIMGVTQIEEAKGRVDDMKARVDIRCSRIRAEITANTAKFVKTIQERESILLGRLDKVRSVKIETLDCQKVDLTNAQICLRQISDQLRLCIQSGREMELINATNKAMESMKQAQDTCGNLAVHEDDVVDFALPDPAVLKTLSTVSFVGGSGFADKCLAEGDGLKKGILGKDSRFIVVVKDHLNEQRSVGGEPLNVNVLGPDGRPVRHNIFDGQNGTYRIIWKPTVEGDHIISVTLKNCHIQQSPFKVIQLNNSLRFRKVCYVRC